MSQHDAEGDPSRPATVLAVEWRSFVELLLDDMAQEELTILEREPLLARPGIGRSTDGMIAAMTTSVYGTDRNSAIRNAAAPITGGINWPPVEATASMAPAM